MLSAYPRTEYSKATAAIYYERLSRFSAGQLSAAVDSCIDRYSFFPAIAEIIEGIKYENDYALLNAPQPSKDEAAKVVEQLHAFIAENEKRDNEREAKKIAERKALLKKQAALLNAKEKEY